ncbi:CBS domain-containing protein [Brevundimonas sp. 2R-24]|uniref:CBS domain-containing protein n=1 Tax=Peiella sedimenti TaxID=3061083 RepID=A0ABT8SHU6_9CAUL|nr:CBS domain-containing protein [Caulobacteraceae bacterium XZ-24]
MKVRDIMTTDVEVARPDETIQSVAERMSSGDFGFMPVCDGRKLQGAVTDRDLAVRALAKGLPPQTPVAEVMTRDIEWRTADDDARDLLDVMGSQAIRRLPIVDDERNLVGVVSIGDLSKKVKERFAGEALEDISRQPATN